MLLWGSCPPHSSQRRGPAGARVCPFRPLKPGEGRALPCAPDLGGQAQPPHLPPWEESQGTMGPGALAPTQASWLSGEGWAGCGSLPSPQQVESPSGELVVAGVSPQGPGMSRVR